MMGEHKISFKFKRWVLHMRTLVLAGADVFKSGSGFVDFAIDDFSPSRTEKGFDIVRTNAPNTLQDHEGATAGVKSMFCTWANSGLFQDL